ncbi:Esterase/lipase/thioesterase family protein [Perilla frutescens var. frutescens]|nr:Esterase/lipase/thioesterase family protein [Perilla frutescens var. frutescens]
MQTNVMRLWLSTPILHKTFYPVSVRVSKNSWARPVGGAGEMKGNVAVEVEQELKPLWDDGYGTQTARDYIEAAKMMINNSDAGPPRWFCPVESGPPIKDSPLLLYLPGIDGLGMGMVLHHKAMGKVFQLRCMHVPADDRTPYDGLVKFVENAVKAEHAAFPNKPIYLVGESFGGCLALSVAAANPTIDLVLILVNPATSFNRSQLQPLLPFLDLLPRELLPYILGTTSGDAIKMAKVINAPKSSNSPAKQMEKLIHELSALVTGVSTLAGIIPKPTLAWKLKLLKSGAASSNSRLHAVRSEVLILASGKDSMLPSKQEAERLRDLLRNSRVRFFRDNGHLLLLEDGINLLTVVKSSYIYRRSKRRDVIRDSLPPSKSEFHEAFDQQLGLLRAGISPVLMSTLADGEIVRGLRGVPDEGPVLLVGYHMLLGLEIAAIVEEFLREKNVLVHGLAHPWVFGNDMEEILHETSGFDFFKIFGAIPVSATNICRLLSSKSFGLLYPGGVREALHRKGEAYKLFWPEEPEFVRVAAKYGAKIVPFGVVGEDDIVELFLDYNDLKRIPHLNEVMRRENEGIPKIRGRSEMKGGVSEQVFYVPGFYPKLPGRLYFLFGKAMETQGREELLNDKMKIKEFYMEVKSQVEGSIAYLIKKREEDPFRHLFDRFFYRTVSAPVHDIPSFDP